MSTGEMIEYSRPVPKTDLMQGAKNDALAKSSF